MYLTTNWERPFFAANITICSSKDITAQERRDAARDKKKSGCLFLGTGQDYYPEAIYIMRINSGGYPLSVILSKVLFIPTCMHANRYREGCVVKLWVVYGSTETLFELL